MPFILYNNLNYINNNNLDNNFLNFNNQFGSSLKSYNNRIIKSNRNILIILKSSLFNSLLYSRDNSFIKDYSRINSRGNFIINSLLYLNLNLNNNKDNIFNINGFNI